MEEMLKNVYLLSAVVGGTILVVQTILLLVGGGGDSDAEVDAGDVDGGDGDHGGDADTYFKVLSFKTVVAFVTFFGLTGMACRESGLQSIPTLVIAIGAGAVALYIVAYLMAGLSRLQSKGNLDLCNAVGQNGKVYLRVPGKRSGTGKVIVSIQGRKVECKAVTEGPEIATGTPVRVVQTSTSDTLEVLPLERI